MSDKTHSSIILPGATIGMLGGGQLGRMFAIAARRMGYRVHVLDPTADCPAGQLADHQVQAAYDDVDAARQFARDVDVVTFEFENVPSPTLAAIESIRPVHPSPRALDICRHRLHEKEFLTRHGFPVTRYQRVNSLDDLKTATAALGEGSILKTAEFGYDGKGQVRLTREIDLADAWRTIGESLSVVEQFVEFEAEASVIVARGADGAKRTYAPFANEHHHHILDITTSPADLSPARSKEAIELAEAVADALDLVGVLAVELFLKPDGSLMVNELAPRPHNSGHLTIDACVTSQFEQQLRAVCGLPLGDPQLLRPAAMANLLGDWWFAGGEKPAEPDWPAALRHAGVGLHLYGKHSPRRGRKMGHLTATADSPQAARTKVIAARQSLAR